METFKGPCDEWWKWYILWIDVCAPPPLYVETVSGVMVEMPVTENWSYEAESHDEFSVLIKKFKSPLPSSGGIGIFYF